MFNTLLYFVGICFLISYSIRYGWLRMFEHFGELYLLYRICKEGKRKKNVIR